MKTMHEGKKIALVTGGTGGIGSQIVTELASQNFFVFFTGRDEARGQKKQVELGTQGRFLQADLSSQKGVSALAQKVLEWTHALDLLVNNVGGVFEKQEFTDEGIEKTMAINFVHPYLLSALLLPALAQKGGRIVQLSTGYHHLVRITKADLEMKRFDCGMNVYGRSKLLSVQAGQAFGKLWAKQGVGLHFADPGMAQTPLTLSMNKEYFPLYGRFLLPLIRSMQARTSLAWCASSSVYLASSALKKDFGVYVLPGPRVLLDSLIGYSKRKSEALMYFAISLLSPENQEIIKNSLTIASTAIPT